MDTTTIALLMLIPLLMWRIYARVKQMLARQQSLIWRHWMSAVFFPLFLVWMALTMADNILAVSCLGAGALAGAWAGHFSLKGTRFEWYGPRVYFTPNMRIALVVFLLFAGRVVYRGVEIYLGNHMSAQELMSQKDFVQSPATVLALGLVLGYCASFSTGMIRWRKAHPSNPASQGPDLA